MSQYIDFEQVRRLVSVEAALRLTGWRPVRRDGGGLHGPCPVHGSSGPGSDVLSVSGELWYCHRCGQGGGVLRLWVLLSGMPPWVAARDLCGRAGVPVPYLRRGPGKHYRRERRQRRGVVGGSGGARPPVT